tara:strand:- start:536 stop:1153 length:618 start_codon:yes stop_codon:yes gene_type:complete
MSFPINPTKMALINVDMQNCFIENSHMAAPGGLALLDRINKLIVFCRAAGVLIVHTAHVIRPDGSNIGIMEEILPSENMNMIRKGTLTSKLHKRLNVKKDDILLEKPRFGAFHGTDLEMILRGKGINTIIVSGICTNICCETTAREANVRDFRVFFLTDGTATFGIENLSADEVHHATCATLGFAFAELSTVENMIEHIKKENTN